MEIIFLNKGHKTRFEALLLRADLELWDLERISMFYIFAGKEELTRKVSALYDFQERSIYSTDFGERADFSGGFTGLIKIAYNLFNSFNQVNFCSAMSNLDDDNLMIALEAIKIRFKISEQCSDRN